MQEQQHVLSNCAMSRCIMSAYSRSVACTQGCCEHLLAVTDVRMLHPDDPQQTSAYPELVYQVVTYIRHAITCSGGFSLVCRSYRSILLHMTLAVADCWVCAFLIAVGFCSAATGSLPSVLLCEQSCNGSEVCSRAPTVKSPAVMFTAITERLAAFPGAEALAEAEVRAVRTGTGGEGHLRRRLCAAQPRVLVPGLLQPHALRRAAPPGVRRLQGVRLRARLITWRRRVAWSGGRSCVPMGDSDPAFHNYDTSFTARLGLEGYVSGQMCRSLCVAFRDWFVMSA